MKLIGKIAWGLIYVPAFILFIVVAIPFTLLDLLSGNDPEKTYRYKYYL